MDIVSRCKTTDYHWSSFHHVSFFLFRDDLPILSMIIPTIIHEIRFYARYFTLCFVFAMHLCSLLDIHVFIKYEETFNPWHFWLTGWHSMISSLIVSFISVLFLLTFSNSNLLAAHSMMYDSGESNVKRQLTGTFNLDRKRALTDVLLFSGEYGLQQDEAYIYSRIFPQYVCNILFFYVFSHTSHTL